MVHSGDHGSKLNSDHGGQKFTKQVHALSWVGKHLFKCWSTVDI